MNKLQLLLDQSQRRCEAEANTTACLVIYEDQLIEIAQQALSQVQDAYISEFLRWKAEKQIAEGSIEIDPLMIEKARQYRDVAMEGFSMPEATWLARKVYQKYQNSHSVAMKSICVEADTECVLDLIEEKISFMRLVLDTVIRSQTNEI